MTGQNNQHHQHPRGITDSCTVPAGQFSPVRVWTMLALLMGIVVDRRPTVLPYLMGGHLVLDSFLPYLVLLASQGFALF